MDNSYQAFDETIIVSASLQSNALGRATALASVAPSERVEIWGPATRKRWAVPTEYPVRSLSLATARAILSARNTEAMAGRRVLLWVSKGFPWGSALARSAGNYITVIADYDDHDEELALEFVHRSLGSRLRLNPLREGAPERLRRSQALIRRRADGVTVSSNALGLALGISGNYLRVPHPRPTRAAADKRIPDDSTHLTVGFMGTMRPHKGFPEIVRALRSDPALSFVTFSQRNLEVPPDLRPRWRELPARTPLDEAYASIDVSVVPMNKWSRGAALQLPAKAIDSAAQRTPIAATCTPVMFEYFENGALWIDDWADLGARLRVASATGELAHRESNAYDLARRNLSPESVRRDVAYFAQLRSRPTGSRR